MLSKTKLIFKNHKWAILLALIAAGIIASPQVYFRYDNQDIYQGIEILGIGDEANWLTRVREAYDGHPTISNPYFKDGKDDPYLVQPLGSNIIALLGRLFSLDINNTILLSRFLFPFLVFLLIYGFILLLTKTKLVALATSVFLMLANCLFARQALFKILEGQSPSTTYVNYTRPVNPTMTHLFFFGFLFCFWLFLERKQWRWGILSAITLGLTFYDYFYTWTFLYSFCGVLALIYFFRKRWPEVKRIAIVLFGASLMAIPYLINLYRAAIWPTAAQAGQRIGFLIEGRETTLGFLVPLLFIIVLLFFPRKKRERFFFALALVIAPFIVLNQQLITGKALMNAHYHWYFHLPLAIIFLMTIFFFWVSKINWQILKKTSAILIIVISIFTGIWVQNNSYAKNEEIMINRQRYRPVLNWLEMNAQKEEVVFSGDETSCLVVIYTPLNVFYHPVAYSLSATRERLLDTLFLFYRLDGVGEEEARAVFFKDKALISRAIYGIYYREAAGDFQNMPDELLLELIQKYKESFSISTEGYFKKMLQKYEVNYLVWDTKASPLWQIDQYPFLEKVFEIGDFVIYQK